MPSSFLSFEPSFKEKRDSSVRLQQWQPKGWGVLRGCEGRIQGGELVKEFEKEWERWHQANLNGGGEAGNEGNLRTHRSDSW